jgi:hypothetical protein
MPNGIRWVVERLFAWLNRYRRLNIVYDRPHFAPARLPNPGAVRGLFAYSFLSHDRSGDAPTKPALNVPT